MSEWLPIGTAPKDGTRLLLQFGHRMVCSGGYRLGQLGEPQQDVRDWRSDCCGRFSTPTGWKPLA